VYRIFHATAAAAGAHSLVNTLRTAGLIALLSLAAACKKEYPQCDHFVDLTMTCDSDMKSAPSSEKKTVRMMMGGMCEEAFKNDTSNVSGQSKQLVTEMYAELRERADCTEKATTCEQYDRCTDKSVSSN
jgi:hypothetical protein